MVLASAVSSIGRTPINFQPAHRQVAMQQETRMALAFGEYRLIRAWIRRYQACCRRRTESRTDAVRVCLGDQRGRRWRRPGD